MMESEEQNLCKSVSVSNFISRTIKAEPVSIAIGSLTQGTGVKDHVLLVVMAVIQGTPLHALVDSGASRSFISDTLHFSPPLSFVGAYSSLELANGETIVSIAVAPDVLISIGDVQCRLSLTPIPMMEGISIILGKDWLYSLNPLVDWRTNTLYIRVGDKLRKVPSVDSVSPQPCNIVDKGLSGLQHIFSIPQKMDIDPQWLELYSKLSSPSFWEYQHKDSPWIFDATRTSIQPQGEVKPLVPTSDVTELPAEKSDDSDYDKSHEFDDGSERNHSPRKFRAVKVKGKCIRQPVQKKLEFMSILQASKLANKTDHPMFLGMIRATDFPEWDLS